MSWSTKINVYRKLKLLKNGEESRSTRWHWLEALAAAVREAVSLPVCAWRGVFGEWSLRAGSRLLPHLCPTCVWAE